MNKEKLLKILKSFFYSFIWIAILVFVLDIVTKWAVQNNLTEGQNIPLIPNFLSITLSHNLGAAFGALNSGSTLLRAMWISISVVMSVGLSIYYAFKGKKMSIPYRIALVLMIAGAVGNLVDRALYWKNIVGFDGVIDWIQVYFGSWAFPTFNIADSSLVIGVIIILIMLIIELIKDGIKKGKEGGYELPPKEYEKKLEEENKEKNEENKN